MDTKSLDRIKLPENIISSLANKYIKKNLEEKLSDFGKISQFYRDISINRSKRYFHSETKDIYYDFDTGIIFPAPNKVKVYVEPLFSGFEGRFMKDEEKKFVRLKVPRTESRKRYVDCNMKKSGDGTSWEKAFKTISEAINKAQAREEIIVAEGVYDECLILKSGISIHGGYKSGETLLWKSPEKGKESLITGRVHININNVLLSNLTLTLSEKFKGQNFALLIENVKEIKLYEISVRNNHFSGYSANPKAIGVWFSNVDFYDCEIKDNSIYSNYWGNIYGGAAFLQNSNINFISCILSGNKNNNTNSTSYQRGGALYSQNSNINIINCNFSGNTANCGGDIFIDGGTVTVCGKSINSYNNSPKYVGSKNLPQEIKEKVKSIKLPICNLVKNPSKDEEVFKYLFSNGLIDIHENKKQNEFLKSHLDIESGFMLDEIYRKIVDENIELNLCGTVLTKKSLLDLFKNGDLKVPAAYINNIFLNCDMKRAVITPYDKKMLEDVTRGHWDLWENNYQGDVEICLDNPLVARNPENDINHYGIVAIDFGTKSTVVVYQKDDSNVYIKRIGVGDLEKDVSNRDYENPTLLEFRSLENFLESYSKKIGRPETRWEDLTTSYTAFSSMLGGESKDYYSIFADLKQWAGKGKKVKIKDKQGKSWDLPQFNDLNLDEGINPIEIYAYYIGLGINNMHGDGIFIDYILSFPVKYEKELCEKIRYSFEKGLKKSLPPSVLESSVIDGFKVRIGASEPAAYAVCALQEYGFEPMDDEKVFYGIFDFGGGTTDFDFGIWREAKSRSYDFEIEHFYDNGDRYLGGENLLQLLAFEIFKAESNQKTLKDNKITFILPPECKKYPGSETLISESQESELNMRKLMEECRYFWENDGESFKDSKEDSNYNGGVLSISLYDTNGEIKQCELNIDESVLKDVLVKRIDKGVKNFFEAWREATGKVESYDKFHIFLAGNSSKSILVEESFERHIDMIINDSKNAAKGFDFKDKFEIFPPLGTEQAKKKQEERGGSLEEEIVPPTGKTGVAYGLIRSRESGKIKVIKRGSNKIKYFIGSERRRKFEMIMNRDTDLNNWIKFFPAERKEFEIFYTDLPEATTNLLAIKDAKRVRCSIDEVNEEKDIYIRAVSSDTLEYIVAFEDELKGEKYQGKVYMKELRG